MRSRTWYKQLGFSENPFSIKPSKHAEELIGYNLQQLYMRVEQGGLVFVEGIYGTGKTSLLRLVKGRFSRKHKVLYYACNRKENHLDFDALLEKSTSFLDNVFGREQRGIILLLDEAQELTKQDFRRLYYLFQSNVFRSVVLMFDEIGNLSVPFEYETFAHCHHYRLESLTSEQAVSLVRKRVGELPLLTDVVIKRIFCCSGRNPRRLLKHCEQLCRYAVEHNLNYISVVDLDRIIDFTPYANGHADAMGDMRLMPRHQIVTMN